jgi:hypothetical protein
MYPQEIMLCNPLRCLRLEHADKRGWNAVGGLFRAASSCAPVFSTLFNGRADSKRIMCSKCSKSSKRSKSSKSNIPGHGLTWSHSSSLVLQQDSALHVRFVMSLS